MTPEQRQKLSRLNTDFPYFAEKCLKIKDKDGSIVPLKLNAAQKFFHECAEKMLNEVGYVRMIVLKGRQEGLSTCIGGRLFHKTSLRKGKSTFIIGHIAKATENLYRMVNMFQDHVPVAMKTQLQKSTNKELVYKGTNSSYALGTAGNKDVGRSSTIQLLHCSEIAFWENTQELETGLFQCVADKKGTEIYLESTANGVGNFFHKKCMAAVQGKGAYRMCFIPWFWQDEYEARTVKGKKKLTEKEIEYMTTHMLSDDMVKDLPKERLIAKMIWRREKIVDFGDREWKFSQEYPSCVDDAFQTSTSSLIQGDKIQAAMKCKVKDLDAALVMGVDPARKGDRTCISFRRGREVPQVLKWEYMDEMRLAGIVAGFIQQHNVDKVFIDTGYGYGTIDRLRELGYGGIITPVHFSHAPIDDTYLNKRVEMWCLMREWFHDGGVNIPDDPDLQIDLGVCPDFIPSSNGRVKIPPKDEIRKECGFSPDLGDSLALTFAYPVFSRKIREGIMKLSSSQLQNHGGRNERPNGLRRKRRVG